MKSQKLGTNTSKAEVLNISLSGIWLLLKGKEFFLPYEDFPWFKNAKISQIPAAFVRQVLPENSPLSPILTMVGTIVISYLFYLGCERPFMRRYWKNRMGRQQ